MEVKYAALTDVGRKRPHNEDNYLVDEKHRLYLVCDGMGGHEKGEVASQIAVTRVKEFFEENEKDPMSTWPNPENPEIPRLVQMFSNAIQDANWHIFHQSQKGSGARKMGTTAVGIAVGEKELVVAHVGDSRCYLIRDGQIEQVTEDHSLLADYIKHASLTEEEIKNLYKDFFDTFKPDVIHAHNMHYFSEIHARLLEEFSQKLGVPLILTAHNTWDDILFLELAHKIKWSHIIAVSHYIKKELMGVGIDDRKITVVHHGVDEEKFTPELDGAKVLEDYPKLKGKKVIFHPARIGLAKGCDISVKALILWLKNTRMLF